MLRRRHIFGFLLQLFLVAVSYIGSFALRLNLDPQQIPIDQVTRTLPLLIVLRAIAFLMFRLDRSLWRYVSIHDLTNIVWATTTSSIAFGIFVILLFGLQGMPRSIFILDWVGTVFLLSGARLITRMAWEKTLSRNRSQNLLKRLLIIGTDDEAVTLCSQAIRNTSHELKPVAFVDDSPEKQNVTILGVPVLGRYSDVPRLVEEHDIDIIIIALTRATPSDITTITESCLSLNVAIRIIPRTTGLLSAPINIGQLKQVDAMDLLGRAPAELDGIPIQKFINGKRILVTGAGGSVGSELCRQLATLSPSNLVIVDRSENPLFFLDSELRSLFPHTPVTTLVTDIGDKVALTKLMLNTKPEVLFHAAAYKHVPLMEITPAEAVKNNVGATKFLAQTAHDMGVKTFIFVSTDKAVNPISVMGTTKRVAEIIIQEMNSKSETNFLSVRFGNVLGSNASVVPIFNNQISNGGPVTVTHPEAERYFMSMPEAAGLILQAAAAGSGGEIFVLDMGRPIKIIDLATTMITLSGLKPYQDIDIRFTGLRPGEKLSEQLSYDSETFIKTRYDKLLVLPNNDTEGDCNRIDDFLLNVSNLTDEEIKAQLKTLIPEYKPFNETRSEED